MRETGRELPRGVGPQHVGKLRLVFAPPLRGLLALGQVAQDARELATRRVGELAQGKVERHARSVLAESLDLAADPDDVRHSRLAVAGEITVVLLRVRQRHEHRHVLAHHFRGAVAEHLLGGKVE